MPCPFFPIPNQLIAQQTVLNLLVAYTIWKCKLFKRNLAKDSSLMLFVFFSFLFCPPPLYSLLCNANEQVLFVPKVSFYEFLFSFFFSPQESHPVAWFQLVLHLIQILAMPLDWKFSPSLNRNRLSCTLSLGPKFWMPSVAQLETEGEANDWPTIPTVETRMRPYTVHDPKDNFHFSFNK